MAEEKLKIIPLASLKDAEWQLSNIYDKITELEKNFNENEKELRGYAEKDRKEIAKLEKSIKSQSGESYTAAVHNLKTLIREYEQAHNFQIAELKKSNNALDNARAELTTRVKNLEDWINTFNMALENRRWVRDLIYWLKWKGNLQHDPMDMGLERLLHRFDGKTEKKERCMYCNGSGIRVDKNHIATDCSYCKGTGIGKASGGEMTHKEAAQYERDHLDEFDEKPPEPLEIPEELKPFMKNGNVTRYIHNQYIDGFNLGCKMKQSIEPREDEKIIEVPINPRTSTFKTEPKYISLRLDRQLDIIKLRNLLDEIIDGDDAIGLSVSWSEVGEALLKADGSWDKRPEIYHKYDVMKHNELIEIPSEPADTWILRKVDNRREYYGAKYFKLVRRVKRNDEATFHFELKAFNDKIQELIKESIDWIDYILISYENKDSIPKNELEAERKILEAKRK